MNARLLKKEMDGGDERGNKMSGSVGWERERWYFSIARGGNVGVMEERLNWVTRLVSSTRLKHPLAA